MTCQRIGDAIVCGPGMREVAREESAGIQWCFRCRKRVEFTDRLMADIQPSYYEPNWVRKCPKGHEDGDLFPGRWREFT
jgi:hypothetical protein